MQPQRYRSVYPQAASGAMLDSIWPDTGPEVIEMAERFDATTAPVMERTIGLLMKTGARHLVLDAARARFMTGAGLRVLIAVARSLSQAKGQLVICNLAGQPKEIFETCGFDHMIAVFAQKQDAVKAFAA